MPEDSHDHWFDRRAPRRRRPWSHPRHDRVELVAAVGVLLAVTVLVVVVLLLYPAPGPAASGTVAVVLSLNGTAPNRTLNPTFWGINVGLNLPDSPALTAAVTRSPVHVVRFPGGAAGDELNYSSGLLTNDSGLARPAVENLSEFAAWCHAIGCAPLLELPGEIDDPSTAAFYVAYAEQTLGLHPVAWEVGNEPALWSHFGLPWSRWALGQNLAPTPSQYARVVQAYVAAIHRVDPNASVLGLPGVGTGAFQETAWINATVTLNGPNISGVAIHSYPAGSGAGPSPTIQQFLLNTSGPRSLPARLLADRAAIAVALPNRSGLPIYVTELGTGLTSGSFGPFLYSFPAVTFVASELLAASLDGALSVELTQVQTPHGGSWMDQNATVHPLLLLYDELLPQLGPSVVPVDLVPPLPGLIALAASAGTTGPAELFVVNANTTTSAQLALGTSGLVLGAPATRWTWNASTSAPLAVNLPNVGATALLPPDSLLLLKLSGGFSPAVGASMHAPRHAPAIASIAGAAPAMRRET